MQRFNDIFVDLFPYDKSYCATIFPSDMPVNLLWLWTLNNKDPWRIIYHDFSLVKRHLCFLVSISRPCHKNAVYQASKSLFMCPSRGKVYLINISASLIPAVILFSPMLTCNITKFRQ